MEAGITDHVWEIRELLQLIRLQKPEDSFYNLDNEKTRDANVDHDP
jgi:hypothetical protein